MEDPLQEVRVQDFIEDKLQSTTDIDHLDDLLASVELQRTQLQIQLDDATKELDAARRSGVDRQESLARRIDDFDTLQRSIDVRLQIVASSDAPDEAIRRLEPPMRRLHRVSLALDYLCLLRDVETLRAEARSHLPGSPKAALQPYARLRQLSARLRELQVPADGAATHLVAHVDAVAEALWSEMKATMSDEMRALLAERKWPSSVQPDLLVDEEWRGCFEKLVDLQIPEILYDSTIVPLLPIDVMAQIWVKEFRYHFLGNRPTANNRLIGQHCFPWVLRLVSTWEDFFRDNFGYTLSSKLGDTPAATKLVYMDPVCALITSLLPVLREKVSAAAAEAVLDPSLLSSFIGQLLTFDEDIRTRFGYDDSDGGDGSGWDGLTAGVLETHFVAWLQGEKDFALTRFKAIMDSAEARAIDYDYGGPGKTKPTFAASRVTDLLKSVTSQYERVRRFSHRLRFLIDIQLAILDEFHDYLRGSLEAYMALTSTFARTLQGATKEQLAALEGTGALEVLCKVYGGADHVVNALEDWSNEEFFVVFWQELQDRAKKKEGQESIAGGLSFEDVKERTSAAVGSDGDGAGAVIFDEIIAAYSARRKAALKLIVSSLADAHYTAFRPYLRLGQWTTISDDPSQADPSQLAISPELDEPLRIIKRNLDFLHRALSTAAFRRVWREALDKLNDALWDGVLMGHSFTAFGAAQFARDLQAVTSLVERYIPDGSAMLLSVQEGIRLLSLPLDPPGDAEDNSRAGGQSVITLRQANDRILMDDADARKLLEELGIETLTLANARHILQRRVEVSA
ncbi:RINT-1 family protein [Magnaporthiopsis poae ATCC 64411]|uniref:RINT-1 family protein n=1 Tax=Magnaporthiopsis poae (strain ATCC 64411 / 73-15) TaxID=644358 RepID=A0A0C4DV11_MAGP6|nr:RINT-1 family protein [Magnaporthiopsis poae ATCC 64411]